MRIDCDKAPRHVQLQPFQAKALGARAAAHGDQHALGGQGKFVGPGIAHMHALLRDMEDLERFVLERIYALKGISRVQTHMILKRYKSRRGGLRL